MSAEATVVRNYIDTLVGLPWKKKTKVSTDLKNSEDVLDADHYGLEKVKERIVEYLAVQQRVDKLKAPILCLVGPPGVGKTSLGQSIARATNRKFVRMSLGGVRDEAEIRGHRRTYIGSMPGKILQNMTKVGVKNPLFLLDEVDKMGMDFRGDPSSALLEVLDPEQNHTFVDHYVEVEYDLSDVMFVATANTLNIPAPLLDRMEIIRLSGYTEDEKVHIAKQYLLPKQFKANGIKDGELTVTDAALRDITRYYTREAGVRGLDRELAKISRKVIKSILTKKKENTHLTVNIKNLDKYLGVRKYTYGIAEKENQIGQVTGLAWTEVGGELLTIEAVKLPGKGNTGHHRQAGRRDERIDQGRDLGGARARQAPGHQRGLLPAARPAHPPARGRHAQGRAVGGHRHRHGDHLGAHRHPGALRCRDDGRDHAARRSAADRRPEGEAAGGPPRRHQERADPPGEREGPGGDPGGSEERHRDHAGALVRRGPGARPRAQARAARGRARRHASAPCAGNTATKS
jgi:ATP-dependent Lon protease